MEDRELVVVTGSSGFIGKHVCAALNRASRTFVGVDRAAPPNGAAYTHVTAELRDMPAIRPLLAPWSGRSVIHLAAEAEVVTPWDQIPATFSTNLNATWNVLTALETRLIVFPSTCSVYGTAERSQSLPRMSAVKPLSLYGASKSMGEILLRDWATGNGAVAVIFRLGNVIGAGCRGLIPFLVGHAKKHPEGDVPAQLRGQGKLLRDYTPVEYVVQAFQLALDHNWKSGTSPIFNIGTGRGIDNREIAGMVTRVLERNGYRLQCNWDNPVPAGEAIRIVLNPDRLEHEFGLKAPSPEEVEKSVEESVLSHLK